MGFITGTSGTITVQAHLTNAGKKKLFNSIEGGDSSPFITKFALGDSDANYAAIDNGASTLQAGHVPESGDYNVRPRSFALYSGLYRPGVPVILHNGDPASPESFADISIGGNEPAQLTFSIKTEWPKDESFDEDYWIRLVGPSSIDETRFAELFSATIQGKTATLIYNGGASLTEIGKLTGSNEFVGESDFRIEITGKQSRRWSAINVRVTN